MKDKYRAIFENTEIATITIEEDTTISLANREFERLSGYSKSEIEGKKSWTEFVSKQDIERIKEYNNLIKIDPDIVPKYYNFMLVDRHNENKDVFACVSLIPDTDSAIVSLFDMSEQKKDGRQSRSAAEGASIEMLSEKIAEEFDDILTAIMGCGKILQMKTDKYDPSMKYIAQILEAAGKAAEITRGIYALKKKTGSFSD